MIRAHLGDLQLRVGHPKSGGQVGFPAPLARPAENRGGQGGNLQIPTGQGKSLAGDRLRSRAFLGRNRSGSLEIIQPVVKDAGGEFRAEPIVEVIARGHVEPEPGVDGNRGVGKGAGDSGEERAGQTLRAGQVVGEGKAKIRAHVRPQAGGPFRDDKLFFRKSVSHGPAGSCRQVGEVPGFRDPAGAVALGVVEVQGGGELGGKLEVQSQSQCVLLVQPPVETVAECGGRAGVIQAQSGGLGIGIVGQPVGGKGGEADLVREVDEVGSGQAVVGPRVESGVGKNVGGPPVHCHRMVFGEGMKVAGGVGKGVFVEKIGFGRAPGGPLDLGRVIQVKEAVIIKRKTHAQLVGDLFVSTEK